MGAILSVKNPRWARNRTAIDLTLEHAVYGEIPFTADPNDSEAYGRALFELALRGEFGRVADEPDNGSGDL